MSVAESYVAKDIIGKSAIPARRAKTHRKQVCQHFFAAGKASAHVRNRAEYAYTASSSFLIDDGSNE